MVPWGFSAVFCLFDLWGFLFVCLVLFYVLTENKAVASLTLSQ